MRSVVLVAALLGALGCGKRINPAWCQQPENQSASDCPVAISDAATQETSCSSASDCASDPINKQCLTSSGANVCVACLDSTQCGNPTPVCTADHVCLPCEHDFECGTNANYCQDGQCQASTSAYYASPSGTGSAAECAITAPCSLTDGIARAVSGQKVLRLIPDPNGNVTFHVAAAVNLVNLAHDLRISGVSENDPNKRIVLDGGGQLDPMILISGSGVELDYLSLTNAKGTAIACSGGRFIGRRLYIHGLVDDGSKTAFTASSTCTLTLDSSVITGNKRGALDASGSLENPFAIHNNVFADNDGGAAVALHGNGRFEYNTVFHNHGRDGTSGVACTAADGVTLDMNIIANNTLDNPPTTPGEGNKPPTPVPAPQYLGCTMEHGFSSDNVDLRLQGGSDPFTQYHLTIATPLSVVNVSDVVCTGNADIDLSPRPAHARCDMGADECADCQFADIRNTGYQNQSDTGHHN